LLNIERKIIEEQMETLTIFRNKVIIHQAAEKHTFTNQISPGHFQ